MAKVYEKHSFHCIAKKLVTDEKFKEFEYAVVQPEAIKGWPKNKNIHDYYVTSDSGLSWFEFDFITSSSSARSVGRSKCMVWDSSLESSLCLSRMLWIP